MNPAVSKLPWRAQGQSIVRDTSEATQHTIGYFESREDAAYAVRAANALEALYKAAQQALTALEPPLGGAAKPVVEVLRKAIAGAEP